MWLASPFVGLGSHIEVFMWCHLKPINTWLSCTFYTVQYWKTSKCLIITFYLVLTIIPNSNCMSDNNISTHNCKNVKVNQKWQHIYFLFSLYWAIQKIIQEAGQNPVPIGFYIMQTLYCVFQVLHLGKKTIFYTETFFCPSKIFEWYVKAQLYVYS